MQTKKNVVSLIDKHSIITDNHLLDSNFDLNLVME
jgi:hypothetical protein